MDKDVKIKELQTEVSELKKMLSDRTPAFNGNLLRRCDSVYEDLKYSIGNAISNAVGQNLTHYFKNVPMSLEYMHSSYGKSGWFVRIDQKDEARIKNALADTEMKKFQESLDNFAWAVQNAPR